MPRARVVPALALVALLGLVALAPAAQAQLPTRALGIFVDAQGRASGQNVAAVLAEEQGVLSGFTSLASGRELFDTVSVDGFEQTEKIQGVGSSSLTLKGTNAVLTLTDAAGTILDLRALGSATFHYRLPEGVQVDGAEAAQGILALRGADSRALGHLVALGHDAHGEVLEVAQGEILVAAGAGSEVVFLGAQGDEAFHDALVHALAQGRLAAAYATTLDAGALAASQAAFGADAAARSALDASGALRTDVVARSAILLAYDLAYETLPVHDGREVAAYLDGHLVPRAARAADALDAAAQGAPAFFAQARDGRAQILVATPAGAHAVALQANASASTQPQAQAERHDAQASEVSGGFELHENGKLTGSFSTSIVRRDALQLWGYTELATRAEVLRNLTVGSASASAKAEGPRYQSESADARLVLVDDAFATILVQAKRPVLAALEAGADVRARQVDDRVVALEAAAGHAGDLILTGDVGASTLAASADGRIEASLDAGATLLFRAGHARHASDDAVAQGIAAGRVGAQVLAGVENGALATTATAFGSLSSAKADASAQGGVAIEYAASSALAQVVALDARGASLAARTAADVQVTVDGAPALAAASLDEVLAHGTKASSWAETAADGSLRVLVNTGAGAGHAARILVQSRVAAAAREAASRDAFGAFHVYEDGRAVGSFVTLRADTAAGVVTGYSLVATGQTVFASLAAGEGAFQGAGADGATTLTLENRAARLELADTTTGYARILAKEDTQAAFRLGEGVHARSHGAKVVDLVTEGGRALGALVLVAPGQASSFEQAANGEVRARLAQGATILFQAHVGIAQELSDAQRAMVHDAIAAGRIAGAVLVQTQDSLGPAAREALESTSAAEGFALHAAEAQGTITAAVTTSWSGDVQMVTAATRERVDVTLTSAQQAGRTLLISLDNRTVEGLAAGDAEILFDGKLAREASSYADVLDPTDDDGVAEYFVLAGEAGVQVLVSVPHFSVHTVTLKEHKETPNGAFMYATFALALVVVAQSVLLIRRKRT